jgi:NAD+ synthase
MNTLFQNNFLRLNTETETQAICSWMRRTLTSNLKRRGFVVGVSGGIDSTVTLGLAAMAAGPEKVCALLMPEKDSDQESFHLGRMAAEHFGVQAVVEDITPALEGVGHYRRFEAAVQTVVPEYGAGWRSKLVTSNVLEKSQYTFFYLVAQAPDGTVIKQRLPHKPYLEILAAMNFKQRTRKMMEYHHADRLHFAVAGTPNRLEYELGFFVKLGDGAADIKPIAHLYKSQVYQLAEYLKVPREIITRPPTTDTFSMPQGQDEFFFSLPFPQMDLCLYAKNNCIPAVEIAPLAGLTENQVKLVFADIESKRSATRYLHLPPLILEKVNNFFEENQFQWKLPRRSENS